jgi:two-component system, NtrC family, nitrogen regulation sensor histidine kinase NtrY
MTNLQPDPELQTSKYVNRRRRLLLWVLGAIVFFLLAIIVSQQLWLWTVIRPDTASDTLALYALSTLNFVAFVVFSFILARNLVKLRRERKERQLGSRIKTRLLIYFISLSFLPITAMAVYSYLFLNRSLEKWFSPFPEELVAAAKELRRQSLINQNRSLDETAALLAAIMNTQPETDRPQLLDAIVAQGGLSAVEIIDSDGNVIARSSAKLSANESEELDALLRQVPKGISNNELADGQGFDLVTVPLSTAQMLVVVPARRPDELNYTITDSQGEYQKLVKKQRKVRSLGISTLGLMTLMLFFVSSWAAIYLARGISTPIKALAEASDEVARGNLSHRVATAAANDELALLAHSFNQMTAQLEENRRCIEAGASELREKNLALEERRDYIETVLESLSTGVVSLDENDCVTTLNAAAARVLRLERSPGVNDSLGQLVCAEDEIIIDGLLRRARRTGQATEQAQLAGKGSHDQVVPVALTATALRRTSDRRCGVVLVIEDLSELLAAQRAAAWSEVARRMAHEIKNPLTPIQLSAERIARSYHRHNGNGDQNEANETSQKLSLDERVGAVIDECTDTISREVEGLKSMVDEFSRFARLPVVRLELADLNEVVRHAVALYEDRLDGVTIDQDLDPLLPATFLDSEQMRRAFVNLLDNALNALAEVDEGQISITTRQDTSRGLLVAQIADNGHGIRPTDFKRLFQPYFSTRGSGTGLGLAIVQRIVLEHRGRIRAEPNHPRGARFLIELPVAGGIMQDA